MHTLLSSSITKELLLKRGNYLVTANSIDTNIYYVKSGTLRIFVNIANEEQNIRFGYPGDLITAMDSFLSGKPTDFTIQAIKKCEISILPKSEFLAFINSNEINKEMWINTLEDTIAGQLEREKDLLISSNKVRYERVLKRSPRLFQEIPAKHIANYLKMSAETLSRLQKS